MANGSMLSWSKLHTLPIRVRQALKTVLLFNLDLWKILNICVRKGEKKTLVEGLEDA